MTWNAAAERLFGYTAGEMIGEPLVFLGEEGELSAGIAERRSRVDLGEHVPPIETLQQMFDLVRKRVSGTPAGQWIVARSSSKLIASLD